MQDKSIVAPVIVGLTAGIILVASLAFVVTIELNGLAS